MAGAWDGRSWVVSKVRGARKRTWDGRLQLQGVGRAAGCVQRWTLPIAASNTPERCLVCFCGILVDLGDG